jgi:demethylmenaquinone methyltransferase / 2-methoxy-6-polyprenyl-1,4-benzoquinol methylase
MERTIPVKDGARTEKARAIREMFASIASRYDRLNHILSGNVDQHWRSAFVRELEGRLPVSRARILDIGCGTGDLSLACARLGSVVGCDFCPPMLVLGKRKISRAGREHAVDLLEADALCLPFAASSFDAVVSAFVVRNLVSIEQGLQEMRRVLRPHGVLGILDFAMPKIPLIGSVYRLYFTRVLPRLGKLLSGEEGPYAYLAASVQTFPPPDRLRGIISQAGFSGAKYRLLTGGIAVLHLARS